MQQKFERIPSRVRFLELNNFHHVVLQMIQKIKLSEASVQDLPFIPDAMEAEHLPSKLH